jgi:N-hydroxyarylamine O-acetyltransferase
VEVGPYLKRIGYDGPLDQTAETLRALHRAHLLNVPFENLDIPLGNKIAISVPSFYDKIVGRGRGGFCYELNGLFGWLLEQLGFEVSMHSARGFEDGEPGLEFDHLVLRVQLEERWLADVGFGDSFLEPMCLDESTEREQQDNWYRLSRKEDDWTVLHRRSVSNWEPQYGFTLVSRRLEEFSEMCEYHQTSPDSSFTQKRICSMATETGRISLSDMRLIITESGVREERELSSIDEYGRALRSYFGMQVEGLERLAPDLEY